MATRWPNPLKTIGLLSVLILWLAADDAVAQDARLQVRGGAAAFQERESYAGGARVSGELLAGLSHESRADSVEIDNIRIDYRGAVARETVCVRFTTGDGRYWALVPYEGEGRYVRPPVLDVPTRFDEVLSQYPPGDFLALAALGDCEGWMVDEVVLVPARVGEPVSADVLVVHVNVNRGTVSAVLVSEDGLELPGTCTRPDSGPRVAYSRTCRIELDRDLSGQETSLMISVRSLIGATKFESYTIALW